MYGQPKDLWLSLDFTPQMVLEPVFQGCSGSPSKAELPATADTEGIWGSETRGTCSAPGQTSRTLHPLGQCSCQCTGVRAYGLPTEKGWH